MRVAVTLVAVIGAVLLPGAAPAGCHCLPVADVAPAWSPDDTKIAYAEALASPHVVTVATGYDVIVPAPVPSLVYSPDWTKAATIENDNARGYLLTLVGVGGTLTTLDSAFPTQPAWSPDGERLAYVGADEALYVIRADGSGRQLVAAHVNPYSPPAWSPDGKHLAYVAGKDVIVDGHNLTAAIAGNHYGPTWAPGSDAVAFDTDFGMEIGVVGLDGRHLLGVDSKLPAAPTRLALSWSPAGDMLLYSHHANSTPEESGIVRIDIRRATQERLTAFGVDAVYSHDGRTIAFGGRTAIQSDDPHQRDCVGVGIWAIPAEGGAPKLVTTTCKDTPATLSLHAPRTADFGRRVDLSGSVLPGLAAAVVDLDVHPCGRPMIPTVAVATAGYWSQATHPRVTTDYVATVGDTSVRARVAVTPVVVLRGLGKLRFEVRVTPGAPFAGRSLHVELRRNTGKSTLLRRIKLGHDSRARFQLAARQLHAYLESLDVAVPRTPCLAPAVSNDLAVSRPQ